MDVETNYFMEQIQALEQYQKIEADGQIYYQGTMEDKDIILNVTGMGTVKAAMATACAISKFHPTFVLNGGTAGAQIRELSIGDLVLVGEAVNINALSMPKKNIGEGSSPFSWSGFHTTYYKADSNLYNFFVDHESSYTAGKVVHGRAATGDIYSREADRIIWLEENFHTVCEDMESASVYEVCDRFETPCMGLRVISNNEFLGDEFNEEAALRLQEYLWGLLAYF